MMIGITKQYACPGDKGTTRTARHRGVGISTGVGF